MSPHYLHRCYEPFGRLDNNFSPNLSDYACHVSRLIQSGERCLRYQKQEKYIPVSFSMSDQMSEQIPKKQMEAVK